MRRKSIIVFLLLSGLFVLLTACNQNEFDGTRVANPDSYRLDIEKMNGTDSHTLKLDVGDKLDIHFETEQGSLHMEIKAPDGSLIYAGNGEEATDFTVNISENGAYSVRVGAEDARGKIYIRLQRVGTGAVSTAEGEMR